MAQMNGIERLEDRVLMAGNVTADLSAGVLTITGDVAANDLQVYTQLGSSGAVELVLVGRNGTTVNAGAEATVLDGTDTASIRSISINLGQGNDVLDINGLSGLNTDAGNNLLIDGGYGGDQLAIADVNLANFDLIVTGVASNIETPNDPATDDGNDIVSIGARQDLVVLNSISVSDVVGSNQVYITDAEVATNLAVTLAAPGITTADTATVYLSGVSVTGAVAISTGDSADTVVVNASTLGGANITTAGLNDDISVHGSIVGALSIDGGVGTDRHNVYETQATTITLTNGSGGSAGNEEVFGLYNTNVSASVAVLSPGASTGNDIFSTDRLTITGAPGILSVQLGDGDDIIYQVNSGATGAGSSVIIDGGDGNDSLGLNNVNYRNSIVSFTGGLGDDNFSVGGGSTFNILSTLDNNGTNGFYVTDSTVRNSFSIDATGATQNTVYTARSRFLGSAVSIATGGQADNIQLLDDSVFNAATFALTTGDANDTVVVNNASFRTSSAFIANLEGGDDTFTINGSAFQTGPSFSIDGGAGTNTGLGSGNTRNLSPALSNFGTFSPL